MQNHQILINKCASPKVCQIQFMRQTGKVIRQSTLIDGN
ncbi:hypothetical protein Krac_0328 [Ktedonobacter racemifer DSM 44963]|uniref:Uncharacterized protein n=1 Tax=Ktedonobacter racemifer DSM 44963 TaxID=485913 RepID=D6U7F5_KTERA|nr:hypothetical protein Krac_0328 [Ktedonobacter racemifer DSM 44963]